MRAKPWKIYGRKSETAASFHTKSTFLEYRVKGVIHTTIIRHNPVVSAIICHDSHKS